MIFDIPEETNEKEAVIITTKNGKQIIFLFVIKLLISSSLMWNIQCDKRKIIETLVSIHLIC